MTRLNLRKNALMFSTSVGKQENIKRGTILTRERRVLDATRPEPLPFYDLRFNRARLLIERLEK